MLVSSCENDQRFSGIRRLGPGQWRIDGKTDIDDFEEFFGLMMEKRIDEDFSVFLNFENFSDTRQTRFGSIYTGSRLNPVFADIFAPLDGKKFAYKCKIVL